MTNKIVQELISKVDFLASLILRTGFTLADKLNINKEMARNNMTNDVNTIFISLEKQKPINCQQNKN